MHRSRSLLRKAGKSVAEHTSSVQAVGAWPPRYPYVLLHHHRHPSLIQRRDPGTIAYVWHNISSAARALISLCTSQENRENFLALTGGPPGDSKENADHDYEGYRGSIINTGILGQSDLGILKVLALYQDLNTVPYEQNGKGLFNIDEFMDGCGWALEHFHRTKENILPRLLRVVEVESGDSNDVLQDSSDPDNDDERLIKPESNYNFLDAAKDPDSMEGSFMSQTTPEMLETVKMEGITRLAMGVMVGRDKAKMPPLAIVRTSKEVEELREYYSKSGKVRLLEDDTKVMNVALLSARVEEIYSPLLPTEQMHERNDDTDAQLEDDSLISNQNEDREKDTAQVVTQLEVLYELQESSINDNEKTQTQTSVMVGKFEACLDGDPNGNEMQWRLCSYRPAVEFGYFNICVVP